mmetsp:Transcript_63261/g.181951  ORF Transcript_63261/g.181951 Transcript_63261/m.181951 type:complete len:203 (-) Transcript_63261:907-1515(-)
MAKSRPPKSLRVATSNKMGRPSRSRKTSCGPSAVPINAPSLLSTPTNLPSAPKISRSCVTLATGVPTLCREISMVRPLPLDARTALSNGTPDKPKTSTSNDGVDRSAKGTASLVMATGMTSCSYIIGNSLYQSSLVGGLPKMVTCVPGNVAGVPGMPKDVPRNISGEASDFEENLLGAWIAEPGRPWGQDLWRFSMPSKCIG